MSRFFKSAAFPILIVIVLAFFASKLIATHDSTNSASFALFLKQLDRGQVSTVVLHTKDLSVDVTTKGVRCSRNSTARNACGCWRACPWGDSCSPWEACRPCSR